MIDKGLIAGFDWDAGNSSKNELKHGVSRKEAEELFFNEPLLVSEDVAHSGEESRFHAFGKTNSGRLLFAAFTYRQNGTLIRFISVRNMKKKERRRYEAEEA